MYDATNPSGMLKPQELGLNALGALLSLPSVLWGAIVGVLAYGAGTYKDIWWLKSVGLGLMAGSGVQFVWSRGRSLMAPATTSAPATSSPTTSATTGRSPIDQGTGRDFGQEFEYLDYLRDTAGQANPPPFRFARIRELETNTVMTIEEYNRRFPNRVSTARARSAPTTSTTSTEEPGTVSESSYLTLLEGAAAASDADAQEAVAGPSGTVVTPGSSARAVRFVRLADGQVVAVAVYRARFPDRVQAALARGRARRTPTQITVEGTTPIVEIREPATNPVVGAPRLTPISPVVTVVPTIRAEAPPAIVQRPSIATEFNMSAAPVGTRFSTIGR